MNIDSVKMTDESESQVDVSKELRSVFDPLIHSEENTRLQNVQLFLNDIAPYLASKEQRKYVVKRLITGISSTRNKAGAAFAIAFHALIDSELGSKIRNERIVEILAQELDLQKILKVGIKSSLEEQCQLNAMLTVIGILVSLRKFLCLELFANIHSFVLKNRSVLSLKLSYAYDCVLNSVLSEVTKSDYKELLFGSLFQAFSALKKGEIASLDMCLELLVVCRRFPKLLLSLKVEPESWTILDVVPEDKLITEIKSYLPFTHPVLKNFPLVYAFESEHFQKMWQCLLTGEQTKSDQVLFYNLLGIICTQEGFSNVAAVFPHEVLKMIDSIPGDKKMLNSSALIHDVLQNLNSDLLFDALSHFVNNVTIVPKFLVHKGWFANSLSKLEEKRQIKVAKLLDKQMKIDIWSFEAGFSVINSVLKREPNPVAQSCIEKFVTLLLKSAILQPSDEKLVLKEDSKLQVFNLLKKQCISERKDSRSLIDLYLEICDKGIEIVKNRKVVEKSCKYLRKESALVKKLIAILSIDLLINDAKPSYQRLEEAFTTYLKSFKDSEDKFEQIFSLCFTLLSFAKASYSQIVSNEIRNFVATIEFNRTVLEAMMKMYENAEKLSSDKQELEAEEGIDNYEKDSDSQSDLSDSDVDDDDAGSEIKIPKDMIPQDDEIVIDLDDEIDEEQAKALEEFDRKLEQVIVLKSSKTTSDFVETEPAICFFDLLMPILRAKSTSTDVIKNCVAVCFMKATSDGCSKSFVIKLFDLFELQYWSKANSLADLVVEFESDTLQAVAKFIFDCLFVDKIVLTNTMWKNAVRFVVCFVMEAHESVKTNLTASINSFVIGFMVKGKYPTVGQFLAILATLHNDAFWSFLIQAFNESDRSEAKDLTNLLNSTLVILSPDIMSKLPKSPEVGEFMVELCRKLLQESVKSSCQPSIRKKYFQFVSNVALRNERAGSSTKLKSRVGKTLVAFETLEKDSASLNLLRNLSTVFKVDEETLAGVSYLYPMEKDDRKKGKSKKKNKQHPTEVKPKKVKIA